jgi:hypothetical protein
MTMKRISLALVACAVSLAASVAPASAAGSAETTITLIDAGPSPDGFVLVGVLESETRKCVAKRKMTLQIPPLSGDPLILDSDTSSGNGAWSFQVFGKPPKATPEITVKKKVLKNGTVCKGAKEDLAA